MKPMDVAKAVGLGFALLALNLAILFPVVFVYAQLFDPGQPQAHYTAVAPRIGAWTAPIGTVVLLFSATWLFGRRRPSRNALAFGVVIYLAYFILDAAMGLAMGPLSSLLTPPFLIGLVGGALAMFAGATLARRTRR